MSHNEKKFVSFKSFCDYYLAEILAVYPSATVEISSAHMGPANSVYGSEGEKMVGSSYGEINFTIKFNSVLRKVEFFKECDFEWYFGNPQGPLYAVYRVSQNKLSEFGYEDFIKGLF